MPGTEMLVDDLYSGDEVEFRVLAVNEAGPGRPSDATRPVVVRDPYSE